MNEAAEEIVSVVIPTRNRPQLVCRAVKSALDQTWTAIEVVVVIDGPDEATLKALHQMNDYRVRIITLPESIGPGDARNAGVNEASGVWIAFLDDDDEWLPEKIQMQIEAGRHSSYTLPIVATRMIARTPKGDFIWPRKLPTSSEPLSEYLFTRNTFFRGERLIQTSMIFAKKELLQKMPFKKGLWSFEEWDWLLRAITLTGVGIEFVPEPLVIWYTDQQHQSLSTKVNWQYSLAWIQENRHLVTPRAYAGFIATSVSPLAARAQDWKAFWPLIREVVQSGKPKPIDLALYMTAWLVPENTRRRVRAFFTKERKA